jgi:hypothetical protein
MQIGNTPGYLMRRYGIWTPNWRLGTTGLELRAPAVAFGADDLVQLATTVEATP